MENKTYYSVVEDNGGGLHLYIFSDSEKVRAERAFCGLEFAEPGTLRYMLSHIDEAADWDGAEENPQASWDGLTAEDYQAGGWKIVADEFGSKPLNMGYNAYNALLS